MCTVILGEHLIDHEILPVDQSRHNNGFVKSKQNILVREIDLRGLFGITSQNLADFGKCLAGNNRFFVIV